MYNGVRFDSEGQPFVSVKINGVPRVIYTAEDAGECACAYDAYLKVFKPQRWERSLNNVEGTYNFHQLWSTLALVGSFRVKEKARKVLERVKELTENADNSNIEENKGGTQ